MQGLDSYYILILLDGEPLIGRTAGTFDLDRMSVSNIERIEILRGPAVLLYGSQAIGGAVNVIDKRIPTRMPDEDFHFDGFAGVDSATNLRTGAGSLDVGVGESLVFHVDGSWRQTDDVEIGGFQVAQALRADLLADADEEAGEGELEEAAELREAANQRGTVPNSAMESWTINAGLGVILGESTFGASLGWLWRRMWGERVPSPGV